MDRRVLLERSFCSFRHCLSSRTPSRLKQSPGLLKSQGTMVHLQLGFRLVPGSLGTWLPLAAPLRETWKAPTRSNPGRDIGLTAMREQKSFSSMHSAERGALPSMRVRLTGPQVIEPCIRCQSDLRHRRSVASSRLLVLAAILPLGKCICQFKMPGSSQRIVMQITF